MSNDNIAVSDIKDDEAFCRVIKRSRPDCITDGRVTSALFKEKKGVGISVDRVAGREQREVILYILGGNLKGRVKGIAKFLEQLCIDLGVEIRETPSISNPYHIDLFLDQESEQRQNIQAWRLARECTVIYEDKEMRWTS